MKKPKATKEIREWYASLGRISKGGGRPRIPDDELTDAQKKRRERYEASIRDKTPAFARKTAPRGRKSQESGI